MHLFSQKLHISTTRRDLSREKRPRRSMMQSHAFWWFLDMPDKTHHLYSQWLSPHIWMLYRKKSLKQHIAGGWGGWWVYQTLFCHHILQFASCVCVTKVQEANDVKKSVTVPFVDFVGSSCRSWDTWCQVRFRKSFWLNLTPTFPEVTVWESGGGCGG